MPRIREIGEQFTVIALIVGGGLTVTATEVDLLASCVEVAVMVAVPTTEALNTPLLLIVPAEDGLTVQDTPWLTPEPPFTVALQVEVCPTLMDAGVHDALTLITVEGPAPVPPAHPQMRTDRSAKDSSPASLDRVLVWQGIE